MSYASPSANAILINGIRVDSSTIGTNKVLSYDGTNLVYSNAATLVGNIPESQVTNLVTDLANKAPLASPSFTGTVTVSSTGSLKFGTDVRFQRTSANNLQIDNGANGAAFITVNGTLIATAIQASVIQGPGTAISSIPCSNLIGTMPTARLGSGTPDTTTALFGDQTYKSVVTSVAATVPSWLTVSGSPVTTAGTLVITATTGQTANLFLATPNGSTGAISLRALVANDLPATLNNTTIPTLSATHIYIGGSPTVARELFLSASSANPSGGPSLMLSQSDAGTNLKKWYINCSGGVLQFGAAQDNESLGTSFLTVARSAAVATEATFSVSLKSTKRVLSGVTNLGTVSSDVSGLDSINQNQVNMTLGASITINPPSPNVVDGQAIVYRIYQQDVNSYTVAFATGTSGSFRFGTDVTAIPTIAGGTTLYVTTIYNAANDKWDIVSTVNGY